MVFSTVEMRCRSHSFGELVRRCDSGARLEVQETRLSILDRLLALLLNAECIEIYLKVQR